MIDQPQSERLSLAAAVLRYTGVFSAVLYFCGFAYLKYLFRQFNVDIWDLKLGWIDVIPYSWSVAEQVPRIIFLYPVYFFVIIIMIPAMLAVGEQLVGALSDSAVSRRVINHIGLLNLRLYFPVIALLVLFYGLVMLIHEAALYRKDMMVKWQRTGVELRFRTEEGKREFDDITKGKSTYFFAATTDWLYLFTCRQKGCADGQFDTVHIPRNSLLTTAFRRE